MSEHHPPVVHNQHLLRFGVLSLDFAVPAVGNGGVAGEHSRCACHTKETSTR